MPGVKNRSAFFIMSLLLPEVSNMILKICSSLKFGMKALGSRLYFLSMKLLKVCLATLELRESTESPE